MGTEDSEKERKLWNPMTVLAAVLAQPASAGAAITRGMPMKEARSNGSRAWDAGKGGLGIVEGEASGVSGIQIWVLLHQMVFLATGVLSTICNQMVFYEGGAQPTTLLLSLPSYLGMLLVYVFGHARVPSSLENGPIIRATLCEVCSNLVCMFGLQLVGSGTFQVLYSSVVCFTALISKVCLEKNLSWTQWMGILAIMAGLALTSSESAPVHLGHEAKKMVVGIGITLVGCVGYAGSYCLNESLMGTGRVRPQRLSVMIGAYGTIVHFAWMAVYTIPRFDELVLRSIKAKGGDPVSVGGLYAVLVISAWLHNVTFFFLIARVGAVSVGVLTALRAIGVFVASDRLFCDDYASQCMTHQKTMAAMVVAGGIIVYSFGKGAARPKRDVDEEMGWKGLPQHRADMLESSSSSLALSGLTGSRKRVLVESDDASSIEESLMGISFLEDANPPPKSQRHDMV